MKDKEDYVPYSEAWVNEVMKMPKKHIIENFLAPALKKIKLLESSESTEPVEGEMSPRVAKLILAIRNELVKPNVEAYHLLYQIASPNFDKQGDVWAEIEQIASQPSPPNNSNGG